MFRSFTEEALRSAANTEATREFKPKHTVSNGLHALTAVKIPQRRLIKR